MKQFEAYMISIRKDKKMPTVIVKGKITKGYDQWVTAFDSAETLRSEKYGITTIYRGKDLNEPDTIHAVMQTPSMEALQSHMENDAHIIAEAGGDPNPDANSVSIASD